MKREQEESSGGPPLNGNNNMIREETDGGEDEHPLNGNNNMIKEETDGAEAKHLAAQDLKVPTSDMADVAQRLEQPDMVTSTNSAAYDDVIINHLLSDVVHYNPSDLSTWLESMLSEMNAPPTLPYSNPINRLVHTLTACAEAVQQENFSAADILVKQISVLAANQGGAMRKVANYFAEALSRRIYKLNPQLDFSLESSFSDILHMHFYESSPYLKFAHVTANQAILEAFEGCKRVHVIDFGMKQGMQWPALLQALAVRPGGPPSFRLTGIGPPQPDNTYALQEVGMNLAQLADVIRVDFEYPGFVASSLSDLEASMFKREQNSSTEIEAEVIAVNSVFELHKLLSRQGAIEKVLNTVKAIEPKIVTVVEQEADHNSDMFSVRFTEALHYYLTMFDSLEGGCGSGEMQDKVMAEVYLGKEICNVVACEGLERTERHEKLLQWRRRLGQAGFEPICLGSNAFKQASILLSLFAGGEEYKVEEKEGCLTLGWDSRPLIATSAWKVAGH